ncbi:MAG: tetraacyldisaccharide 4'-kinase [Desulfobacteraceae bacterium]
MLDSCIKKAEKRINQAMDTPVHSAPFFSFETVLLMISILYAFCVRCRTLLYRFHILPSRKVPCVVVSIGNITAGGTGKTPMTLYVADLVKKMGYRPVVVSRGYKGRFEKNGGIVSDGRQILCSPKDSGDEPFLTASLLNIPVVVGSNRYKAAITAAARFNPDIIILDDAFQHLSLFRDLNLILLDCTSPFGNGALLPRGRLREPVSAVKRSHAVVFTRCHGRPPSLESVRPDRAGAPFFETCHAPYISMVINADGRQMDEKEKNEFLKNIRTGTGFLFSGIANNEDFRRGSEKLGIKTAGFLEYPDHFWYKQSDLEDIENAFRKSKADFIVTTQKDYVKIKDSSFFTAVIAVTGVQLIFKKGQEDVFETFIKHKIHSSGAVNDTH